MITAISQALRRLLSEGLRGDPKAVVVGRPPADPGPAGCIALLLTDVRENTRQRAAGRQVVRQPNERSATIRRPPVYVDLRYLVIAAGGAAEQQQTLLSNAMELLFAAGALDLAHWLDSSSPEHQRVLSMRNLQPLPLYVAEADDLPDPSRLWSLLGSDLYPWFALRITALLEPHPEVAAPLVTRVEVGMDGGTTAPRVVHRVSAAGAVCRVEGGKPRPLAGARIQVLDTPIGAITDERGFYYLLNLPAGEYTLRAALEGYSAAVAAVTIPREAPVDRYSAVDFTLLPSKLHGTITLPGGRPAPGARVRVAGKECLADREGYYSLADVPAGSLEATVARPGSAVQVRPVALPAGEGSVRLDVTLEPVALSGEVVDRRSGAPIAGAKVVAGEYSTTADADGGFRIPRMQIGSYQVTATAAGYRPAEESLRIRDSRGPLLVGAVIRLALEPEGAPAPAAGGGRGRR